MYGPVSKDGPSMEFGEVGGEIKDEARRRVVEEIVAKLKVDATMSPRSLEPRSRRLILSGAKRTRNT